MSAYDPNAILAEMEQARTAVAALTGIKKQLTDNGWTEPAAEQIVYAMIITGGGGNKQ